MAAAEVEAAAGRGARAGENWGPSGGSYLHRFPAPEAVTEATIRPRPRRVTSSAAALPYHERGRAEPKEAETREVEQVRTDPTWVELSGSGRGPVRPRRGGWSRAEQGRNQIGGAERAETREVRRSWTEQSLSGAEPIGERRGMELSQSETDERGSAKKSREKPSAAAVLGGSEFEQSQT